MLCERKWRGTRLILQKFGRGVVCSNKAENLRKVERFLKSHPKYPQLMRQLKEMPKHLIPDTNVAEVLATTKSPYANARLMQQQVFMPALKPNGAKYMGTIKSALNSGSRVVKVASKGMMVVPIVMGVCDVVQAPPELRMRTLFDQGFGIVGGYVVSAFGAQVVGVGLVMVLGLGPFGAFIALFVCAAGFGLLGSELFKWGGSKIYNVSDRLGGQFYSNMSDFMGVLQ